MRKTGTRLKTRMKSEAGELNLHVFVSSSSIISFHKLWRPISSPFTSTSSPQNNVKALVVRCRYCSDLRFTEPAVMISLRQINTIFGIWYTQLLNCLSLPPLPKSTSPPPTKNFPRLSQRVLEVYTCYLPAPLNTVTIYIRIWSKNFSSDQSCVIAHCVNCYRNTQRRLSYKYIIHSYDEGFQRDMNCTCKIHVF